METVSSDFFFIGKGIALSLQLLSGGVLIGLFLGVTWAICRYQHIAASSINAFISLTRGTPLILQLSLIYFSIPKLTGIHLDILSAGILAFGLNSSAYFAEILRAGIESLPKGQFEAAQTLQIPTFYVWKDIVLPQVVSAIFPALNNEIITMLKDTALISTIGGMDLMRNAESLAAQQFTYFTPLCIAGLYYYVLVLLVEKLGQYLEKRRAYAAHY